MPFSDKVALVTGAGSGIGHAAALLYGREGARVFAADVNEAAARATASAIEADGGRATAHQVDLSSRAAAHAMVAAAVAAFGRVDILANIAGIYPTTPVETATEEDWDRVLAVDLKGPFFACQAAVLQMKAQGSGGVIVNVASGAAFFGIAGLAAYSAAKGGVVSMSRVVAVEAAPYNVRVNIIAPGTTNTPGWQERHGGATEDPTASPLLGRALVPEEIARAILWSSSDNAAAVNGAIFRVDGGKYML
jgi:NAD(P)-dependent dehydrogenase (short-subunit alcohol dehydrogenase family)